MLNYSNEELINALLNRLVKKTESDVIPSGDEFWEITDEIERRLSDDKFTTEELKSLVNVIKASYPANNQLCLLHLRANFLRKIRNRLTEHRDPTFRIDDEGNILIKIRISKADLWIFIICICIIILLISI